MSSCRAICLLTLLVLLSACGDNLFPSGEDKRTPVSAGSSGGSVSQKSPDFSVSDIRGATVNLASATAGKKGAAFYFTMWCPICDSHMSDMRTSTTLMFPDVNFFLVDYVSGSVAGAARAATENGYAFGVFSTLVDTDNTLLNIFHATMGTTVVIDNTGIVRMNEDYRDGVNLRKALAALP
ncbi:MAG: redoxin domain-containing protein [Desulfuromonadaceae bacterium]|nr:redoxin domain-containing protein [Desulfuromonadaceae bacterium]